MVKFPIKALLYSLLFCLRSECLAPDFQCVCVSTYREEAITPVTITDQHNPSFWTNSKYEYVCASETADFWDGLLADGHGLTHTVNQHIQ